VEERPSIIRGKDHRVVGERGETGEKEVAESRFILKKNLLEKRDRNPLIGDRPAGNSGENAFLFTSGCREGDAGSYQEKGNGGGFTD